MKLLNWQKETREAQRVAEARKEREEKGMLKTQWKDEDSKAKAQEDDKLRQMRELNQDLIQHNELEKELKGKMLTLDKEKDKEMIARIMDESKKLSELEHNMKMKRLSEAKETLKTIDNRTELQKQEDLAIERLAEEERQKQIQREDEKFMKEQNARVNLMKEVYEDRAKAVGLKSKSSNQPIFRG
jgi:hypothetical protein